MSIRVEAVSPQTGLADAAFEAYLRWREESAAAGEAFRRWSSAGKADRVLAACAYIAALDREETAAGVYADALARGRKRNSYALCCGIPSGLAG